MVTSTACASSEPIGDSMRQPDGEGRMSTNWLAIPSAQSQRVRLQQAAQPLDLQMEHATTIGQNVNTEEASEAMAQKAATQRCPRCGSGLGNTTPNPAAAEPYEAKGRCTASGYCNYDEIGALGTGEGYGASSRARREQWVRRPSRCRLQLHSDAVARPDPGTHNDEVDTEEPCVTPSKRVKTIMELEICVLEAMDDVFVPIPGGTSCANSGELISDDDDVPPDVTHELDRLKAVGTPYQALSVDELVPKRDVFGTL